MSYANAPYTAPYAAPYGPYTNPMTNQMANSPYGSPYGFDPSQLDPNTLAQTAALMEQMGIDPTAMAQAMMGPQGMGMGPQEYSDSFVMRPDENNPHGTVWAKPQRSISGFGKVLLAAGAIAAIIIGVKNRNSEVVQKAVQGAKNLYNKVVPERVKNWFSNITSKLKGVADDGEKIIEKTVKETPAKKKTPTKKRTNTNKKTSTTSRKKKTNTQKSNNTNNKGSGNTQQKKTDTNAEPKIQKTPAKTTSKTEPKKPN